MASLASLLVPGAQVAQQDYSWLNGIANTIGGAIDQRSENRSFNKLADRIGQGGSQGAMMASVGPQVPMTGNARQQAPMTAPVTPVGRADIGQPNDIYGSFMGAVRQGGIQNPYALAAIAATGRAESGWSPQNANRRWSDPSQSGQAGTAGGILSWRNERLSNLEKFAAQRGERPDNISPQTQAAFFLSEDPELVQRLNAAQSPEEAISIMNNAWRFAGYDQPGGETARRRALTTNYYAQEFRNAPGQQAISQAMGQTGQPLSDAAFEERFSGQAPATGGAPAGLPATAAPGTIMQGQDGQTYQYAETRGMAGATGDQGWIRTSMQPTQVADASGGFQNVPGTQPIPKGGVDVETIQFMLRDPNLREIGLKLWQQNVTGSTGEPWQFVQAPDGTLLRANQQTGAIEQVGRFNEPAEREGLMNIGDGQIYDPNTGEWITAPNAGQPDFRQATPEEAASYGAQGGQFGPDGRFYPMNPPSGMTVESDGQGGFRMTQGPGAGEKFTEAQSKDNVFSTRARGSVGTINQFETQLTRPIQRALDYDTTGVLRGRAQDPDYQVARAAGDEFLNAILRKDTGAAITPDEQMLYGRLYLPQPGDGPEVIAYKREARERAIRAIEAGMSAAQIAAQERALRGNSGGSGMGAAANPQGTVQPGTVEDGYRFLGGDPADSNNWEQVN